MKSCPPAGRQRGIALWMFLLALVLAGGYAFFRHANTLQARTQQAISATAALARAKEALIAYAVTDDKRPGRLLCPDLVGDGISPLLARDDCDAYGGWLPWKTLDLAEHEDGYGGNFRYYLSPLFGGDRSSPPLNSDTATSLRLDVAPGAASNDIAALIVATRGPLDTRNADGDDYFYNGGANLPADNDVVLPVTRGELMAAVEKRIANALHTCLERHAASPDNPEHTYPWPAPLSSDDLAGRPGSLFGRIPATQPGNPDQALKESIAKLSTAKIALESASTATDQLAAARAIESLAAYAASLFDRLYIVAADLEAKADAANRAFTTLDAAIKAATADSESFGSAAGSLPGAAAAALPSLAALRQSLAASGFDPFLMELDAQDPKLKTDLNAASTDPSAATLGALSSQINVFRLHLLKYSMTSNTDLNAAIADAYEAAQTASADVKAAIKALNPDSAALAINGATALYGANLAIGQQVAANRVSIDAGEVSARANGLGSTLAEFSAAPSTSPATALLPALTAARALAAGVDTRSRAVLAARTGSLSALDAAIGAAQEGADRARIATTADAAIGQLRALAESIANNGDSIAQATLAATSDALTDLAAPPTLTAGRALRTPAKTVIYWSGIIAAQAADIARQARKSTWATGDSDTSAYTAASRLLSGLDGGTGAIAALENYVGNPDDTTRSAAQSALADTQRRLGNLLAAAGTLESSVESGMAGAAVPTVWLDGSCAFLQASGSDAGWWSSQGWAPYFFYQVGDRVRPATGTLTVNGAGSYRVVVAAAGPALAGQNRSLKTSASYLEGINADPSRDGDATAPARAFASRPPSGSFNDRLAY